ncbi:AAA family ATPase [Trichlorobacter ammonificans]|uniref:AAA family ATPase n=1 Tax=Trichlorobacter ammonificans TaxID=2916410 RepID=A0ABN8HME4_9BACT|nr:AAA family ATPase [Trichlorobacter ammonificans]
MIKRKSEQTVQRLAHGFPVIAITGPRQSGKTTLARATFPDKPYLSLEDPDVRVIAESDPRRLLAGYPDGAILDEVQRAPHLFSYLQTHVDANLRPGMFVLTGSQQFGLLAGISQSLAGRVGMVQLLPLGINELADASLLPATLDELLFTGGYPALHDRDLLPGDWFAGYVATYVERDVRQLINVRDLSTFQRFLRMCAARTGQLLNLSSLAADCGITHNTAAAWIAVLEASYIIHLLRPHHRNFNKRLVKSPKLYFCDAGLAAWLLGIHKPEDMAFHAQRGNLFETLMVAEFLKQRWNDGRPSNLYFWRDSRGLEVDLLLEEGERLMPVEIKSGTTVAADFTDNLRKWVHLSGNTEQISWLIYGGDQRFDSGTTRILPWGQAGTIGTE